ncbi:MFS transporter [Xenorhabdus bovienii]|uniref:MFS transporter n=1 Tax=Xenorhabdus bovienii TaxID=40576 RepID=UPI0004D66B47|nr:MFS transporter [Xenorhabdus bovienii]CDG90026.1 Putative major facilitator superfamily (MFS) transporter [Xenorhabdus bovienii str. feltiae France]CDG93290.1 Putative major facilitator superfamily (MFS) transporter [Xenorhabdus bovienii str. feltiae Florida]
MPPRFILPVLALAVFFIGTTEVMLSPMLKPLASAFRTTLDNVAWLVSGYALSYALAAPFFGWLSDRVNRRRLLLISLLFLMVDGLALTFAPNLSTAIGLRIFGGIASAALIPTTFALIAELFPRQKQVSAMGLVMLGMTAGIAGGPIFAGVLTELFDWRAPFLVNAAGCLLVFVLGRKCIPIQAPVERIKHQMVTFKSMFQWVCQKNLMIPLIAKGFWNGTAVSALILAGEVLRQHYEIGTGTIGISISTFGIGLGLGNLSVGMVKRLGLRDELILLLAIVLLSSATTAFMLMPLSLPFSLSCLIVWGSALGLAAPISTVILANRAKQHKGQVLAVSESLNNLVILLLIPIATMLMTHHGIAVTMLMLGFSLIISIVLTIRDFFGDTVT